MQGLVSVTQDSLGQSQTKLEINLQEGEGTKTLNMHVLLGELFIVCIHLHGWKWGWGNQKKTIFDFSGVATRTKVCGILC